MDNYKEIIELRMLIMYSSDDADTVYYQRLLDRLIDTEPTPGAAPLADLEAFLEYVSTLKPPQHIIDSLEESEFKVHRLIYEKWK